MKRRTITVLNVVIMCCLVLVSISLLAQEDAAKQDSAQQAAPTRQTVVPEAVTIDFEGEHPHPTFGWVGVSDTIVEGGKSTVVVSIDSVGAGGSGHSLHLSGSVQVGQNPYVMFSLAATRFWRDEEVLYDLSGFKGISFWAMGDGNTYRVDLPTASITDYMYYGFAFAPPAGEWHEYKIPFRGFKQMPYGAKVPWTGSDVEGIHFVTVGGPLENFSLHIDNVSFYKE